MQSIPSPGRRGFYGFFFFFFNFFSGWISLLPPVTEGLLPGIIKKNEVCVSGLPDSICSLLMVLWHPSKSACQRDFLKGLPSCLNHVGQGTFSLTVLAGRAGTSSDTDWATAFRDKQGFLGEKKDLQSSPPRCRTEAPLKRTCSPWPATLWKRGVRPKGLGSSHNCWTPCWRPSKPYPRLCARPAWPTCESGGSRCGCSDPPLTRRDSGIGGAWANLQVLREAASVSGGKVLLKFLSLMKGSWLVSRKEQNTGRDSMEEKNFFFFFF